MPKTPLTRLTRERELLRETQTSKGELTTAAPASRPAPQPDSKRNDLIVPEMPPHVKAGLKQARALATGSKATALPLEFETLRRVYVRMLCAVKDDYFVLVWRQNKFSKKFFHETTILASATYSPAADAVESYDISELVGFDRIKCSHCRSKAGPVKCSAGHFVCTGRMESNYFRCADSCGVHGPVTGGLSTVTGSEHAVTRREPITKSSNDSQARLPPPASIRLLPGKRP
jgi:hypothetical protein